MPAQLLPGTVAVLADAVSQPLDLGDERLSIESSQVFVHGR
jgi:hypothetical protein